MPADLALQAQRRKPLLTRPQSVPVGEVTSTRLPSIDRLRGLVMMLMALDHTRDFLGSGGANPRDIADPALFLTRWITHFCAPTFVFLAGVSACLYGAHGRSRNEVSRFLFGRGMFLIIIEFTVVRYGWSFSFDLKHFGAQVIWVIGASMLALALLIHLPSRMLAAVALIMVVGHNLLDPIEAFDLGSLGFLWKFLHEPGLLRIGPDAAVFVLYPLIPWIGVMALGFTLGPVFELEHAHRRRLLLGMGTALIIGFVLLRLSNVYGDPQGFERQADMVSTILSFINCEKYPPSLLYLMMTLGPALVLLAALEGVHGKALGLVAVFGRVPFFFYIVHIYVIHGLAVLYALVTVGHASWLLGGPFDTKPPDYGLSLAMIYLVTTLVIVALYPLCRWFAKKREQRRWWWSYV